MSKMREFKITRTLDNNQLGCSVMVEALKFGETVLFREVIPNEPDYKAMCKRLVTAICAIPIYGDDKKSNEN